ncbi:alpha-L-rhamnosidase [Halalkalibacter sp. APA_J-10(15)]|uniref:alpha-L-rhamnosidase n=1 Tax=Halalkalibacter sp. APA_J-10(15) TaxID=2933805 RepID=UPI001FF5598B|nr:alpha-L-rhamnosidase [Halalkalibacter sp. APA_J-10(15)]MCK0472784.1 glycoside hydrolase family 78 protein [Halalkalibacter sp. APA_J-10(15)]
MHITKMRVNHIDEPLGYDLSPLRLSWVTEETMGESNYQKNAQVEIALDLSFDEVVYDSGIRNDISSLGYTPDLSLMPRTRYFWRVTVWGNKEGHITSAVKWFETGKLDEEWRAKWIAPSLNSDTHLLIRKEFTLSKNVESARIYICGLGLYHLEVNGEKVGDEYLSPGFHSYDYWLQYQTYDITKLLQSGNNSIGVLLGDGWYKGRFGFDGGYEQLYGDHFALLAELFVTHSDGTETVIHSNQDWQCRPSPILFSNIYDGETYDATKETKGWSSVLVEAQSDWKLMKEMEPEVGELRERFSLPIQIKEERTPIEIIHTPAGETVLDFGQNMTGWVRFKVDKPHGHELKLEYGEILQNGCFYRENLRTAKAEYVYISKGDVREVQPYFTYYGFRYVKLTGFGEMIQPEDFVGCAVYSDIEEIGSIETSNRLVNQLFKNAKWGQKGNFLDIPTDCPQRDERMGWTGDAQIFSSTACFNMYSPAFFTKYLIDIEEEQKRLGGSVPFIVPMIKPENDPGFVTGSGSSAWGDAATIIPWTVYLHYGDKELLKRQFPMMKAWVDFIKKEDEGTGSTRLWRKGFHFGDWLALDGPEPDGVMGGTDPFYIASAYYSYSASIVSKAAAVLGEVELEKEYEQLSNEVKEAIVNEYFTPNARSALQTQTAMIVALYMDLVPTDYRERIIHDLKHKLGQDQMHLNTGFVGTPYSCLTLSGNGASDYAYTLLLNEDYPSWLYAVKLGATTIWERWNSVLSDGQISGTGMNSLNHYAYGSIVDWMYRYMCGINPVETEPGFRKIVFTPKPDARLSYAKAKLASASGFIESGWEMLKGDQMKFTCTVPFDCSATVILPFQKGEIKRVIGKALTKESASLVAFDDHVMIEGLEMGTYEMIVCARRLIYPYHTNCKLRELLDNDETQQLVFSIFPEFEHNPLIHQYRENAFSDLKELPITAAHVNKERLKNLDERLKFVRIKSE